MPLLNSKKMSQNSEFKMSEERKRSLMYTVTLSYASVDIVDGAPVEVIRENVPVEILKLQRRNVNHSKLAMNYIKAGTPAEHRDVDTPNDMELSIEFAKNCIFSDDIKDDVSKDLFACYELFMKEEVREDFDRFFDSWDFLRKMKEESQKMSEKQR